MMPGYGSTGPRVFRVECDGIVIDAGGKYAAERVRLVREVTVLDIGAIDRTFQAKRDRLLKRTSRETAAAIAAHPIPGGGYSRRVAGRSLPKGHPLADQAAAIAAAERAQSVALQAVNARTARSLARIDRANAAALDAAMASL
jgi:hypothetical protein